MEVGLDLTLVLSFLHCLLDALESKALLNLNLGPLTVSQNQTYSATFLKFHFRVNICFA